MRKETKTRRTRKQTDRQRSGITFLSYSVSFQAPFHKKKFKKEEEERGGKSFAARQVRYSVPVSLSLRLQEWLSITAWVSGREREGQDWKRKGGWGGLECRIDVGKLYANSVRVSGGGCDRHIKPPILATSPSSPTYNKIQDRPTLGDKHEGNHHHQWC